MLRQYESKNNFNNKKVNDVSECYEGVKVKSNEEEQKDMEKYKCLEKDRRHMNIRRGESK